MSETNMEAMEPPEKRMKLDEEDGPSEEPPKDTEAEDEANDEANDETNDDYDNFVTPQEVDKLREFKVLDEVKSNEEDSNDDDSDSSEDKDELLEDEIEKMLEADLPEDFKGARKPKEKPYVTRQKVVLEEKGINHFEALPLDWMMVRHYSGMPVYMHCATRVCTLSKPYFLGKGNTRRHDIPISAIPCLAYRTALEEEEKQKEVDRTIEEQIRNGTWTNNINTNNTQGDTNNTDTQTEDTPIIDSTTEDQDVKDGTQNIIETQENDNQIVYTHEVKIEPMQDENSNTEPPEVPMTCPFKHGNIASSNEVTEDGESNIGKENECVTINEKENANIDDDTITNDKETSEGDKDPSTNEKENAEAVPEKFKPRIDIPLNRQPVVLPGGIVMPPPRVETVSTSWKTQHLTPEQINSYCKALFKFKTVNIMHFKRWADRRKYTKARKTLQYPTLPEGTKLITIPAQASTGTENGGKANKRDWVMNMNGRSYLSVFHEYVRRALQKQPVYEFKQLENASSPYQATVYIGGMQYGVGHGSSKRQAKSAAARASIHILIPEMRDHLDHAADNIAAEPDFSFFDYVGIEDPRISEFCAATCEPSPHAILRTCLLRNFGAGDRHIHTEMKKLEFQKIELTMKVGKHTATVVCKNKKTAKQRASQAILQALHPHVRSWGSLLRLYGSRSVKSCKEKKLEEQQITLLQDKARRNEPNYAVLEKLRDEMRKLQERDEAVVPIGTLLVRDDLPTHSGSNLNNVDL